MTLPAPASSQAPGTEALAAFFPAACRAFEQATQRPSPERTYVIGSQRLRVRFANETLVPRLTPALEHLAAPLEGAPATFTVCVWDSASTGVPMPPPPWPLDAYAARGDIRGQDTGRFQAAYQFTPAGVGVLSLLDRAQALGMYWLNDARHLPDYEGGAPLRNLLHWWLAGAGYQFVHAGAVGAPPGSGAAGGVLLAGRGGSGKSTTALACVEAGLSYLADDYCLLAADPVPEALSLYNSAKVRPDGLLRFPQLAPLVDAHDYLGVEKAIVFLHRHFPQRLVTRFPLRAILIPRITGLRATTLTPASPAAALKALAPSTLFQLSGAGPAAFQHLAGILRQVPCYYLEAGTDLAQLPGVIAALLAN